MKKVITLIAICATTFLSAQKTVEKAIGEFSELKVYDLIEVELIQSQK